MMSRTMWRVLALSVAMMLIAGACGDDEGNGETQPAENQQTENAEAAAFCEDYVEAQATVIAASAGGPTDEVPALMKEAQDTVPDELEEQMELIASTVEQASESQDDSAFESDEFTSADEAIDTFVAENCGFERVDVTAVDYAFEGFPPSVAAGTVTIDWENTGEEVHEMILLRLTDDSVTVDDLLKMSDKEAESKVEFVNGAFGPPGTTDIESVPLDAGRYVAVCFLPVGATSMEALEKADGPPHVTKGMSAEFTVE